MGPIEKLLCDLVSQCTPTEERNNNTHTTLIWALPNHLTHFILQTQYSVVDLLVELSHIITLLVYLFNTKFFRSEI